MTSCTQLLPCVKIFVMSEKQLLVGESLTTFFYRNLDEVNKKSLCPLPQEFIWYSSEVLTTYTDPEKYFSTDGGKINEKVLGLKLLEAHQKPISEKKALFKDIGDTTLVQLGLFSSSVKKKSPPKSYYINIGKSAYAQMETLDCSFYDIPQFYNCLLYTSDAADDSLRVDLGGRRIIKKKKFFQAEDGIRDRSPSRGLGDVYKRQLYKYWKISLCSNGNIRL